MPFVKRCLISASFWSRAWWDEALAAAADLIESPFPFGPKAKIISTVNLVSLCCHFFVQPGNSSAVRNFAALHLPSLFSVLDTFTQPISTCSLLKPLSFSNMDSSGGINASQDAHLDLRSSPGRSDLSGLYHLGRTLGRGHFAVVKLGRNVNTGQLVAVKMIDKTKLDVMATSHLLQEVRYEW